MMGVCCPPSVSQGGNQPALLCCRPDSQMFQALVQLVKLQLLRLLGVQYRRILHWSFPEKPEVCRELLPNQSHRPELVFRQLPGHLHQRRGQT